MPVRYRKTNRRNRRRRARPTIKRQMGFIKAPVNSYAQRKFVKMNYSTEKQLISLNNTTTVWAAFNANSLYDPDRTGVGHQPYGYDQWSNIYKAYRVHGCKITISTCIVPDATSSSSSADMFVGCSASEVAPLSTNTSYENPCYRNWLVTNEKPMTKSFYFTIAQIEGVSKKVVQAEQAYRGLMGPILTGADPAQLAFIFVGSQSRLPGIAPTAQSDARCRITLTYFAELFEPKQLAES